MYKNNPFSAIPPARLIPMGLLIAGLFAVVVWLLFDYELPSHTHFWRSMQNTGHTLIFMGVSFSVLFLLRTFLGVNPSSAKMFWLLVFCAMFGGVIEIVQTQVGRSGSWEDFFLDFLGTVAGYSIFISFYIAKHYQKRLLCLVLVVLLVAFYKPLKWKYAEFHRDQQLPILADFDTSWPSPFFEKVLAADLAIVPAPKVWKTNRTHVAKVGFSLEPWPGVSIAEAPNDWRGYHRLSIDVFNDSAKVRKLVVRVHDVKHNQKWVDRYNHTFTIQPGENQLNISLATVKKAPKNRTMDMSRIQTVMLFAYNPKEVFELYLDNIRLHKAQ